MRAVRGASPLDLGAGLLVGAYLAVVAVLAAAPPERPAALASSPDGVLHGRLWPLLTSGIVIDGNRVASVLVLVAAVVVAVAVAGIVATLAAALAGHVGATLVAYGGLAGLRLVDGSIATASLHAPDYGISCVLASWLGLTVAAVTSTLARLAGLAALIALLPLGGDLTGWEHALAFVAGIAVGRLLPRWRDRSRAVSGPG